MALVCSGGKCQRQWDQARVWNRIIFPDGWDTERLTWSHTASEWMHRTGSRISARSVGPFLQSTLVILAVPQIGIFEDADSFTVRVGRGDGEARPQGPSNPSKSSFLLGGIFVENCLFRWKLFGFKIMNLICSLYLLFLWTIFQRSSPEHTVLWGLDFLETTLLYYTHRASFFPFLKPGQSSEATLALLSVFVTGRLCKERFSLLR